MRTHSRTIIVLAVLGGIGIWAKLKIARLAQQDNITHRHSSLNIDRTITDDPMNLAG